MGALLKLVAEGGLSLAEVPAVVQQDLWTTASTGQRRMAELRYEVVREFLEPRRVGAGLMAEQLAAALAAGTAPAAAQHAAQVLGKGLSSDNLKRLILAAREGGLKALLPGKRGRRRVAYGWEARAVEHYNKPCKPGFADVAWRLRAEGHPSATESRVAYYLERLPATLGPNSPARIGVHLHKLTRQKYQRRHLDEVLVGEIYAGDGHTADCYVAHPNTGKPFRPELTAFIDIKSRFPAGYYFTESESAHSTLFSLSSAMTRHDHVPAWLYIDRGAGYRAELLSNENTGWYKKFDIEVIGALPGNPHGKGWIERWFLTVRNKHDKFFADGKVYCGDDMAPEVNRRLSAELASGKRTLPSYYEYVQSFHQFVQEYINEPMDVLGGRTPAQVWAELTPVPVELNADAVMRPSQVCTVTRQTVRLHNRFYYHEALALYDGHKVEVEYDLHKDGLVWIHDLKGRMVCEAKLVNTISVLPTSRLEEQRDKRLAGQLKRLQRKVDEATARRDDAITAETQVRAIDELERDALQAPATPTPTTQPVASPVTGEVIDIDILSWRPQ